MKSMIHGKYPIELTQAIVRQLLDYNPETGTLTWRVRDKWWFVSDRACNAWNATWAGQPAFTAMTDKRYLHGTIFGKLYLAHRIIWLMMTGCWPASEVDHDNHNGTDNRWDNLFEATGLQNSRNQSLRSDNTTGRIGVYRTRNGKFWAWIGVEGYSLNLGTSSTFEEACDAREAAERKYGFHKNHGAPKVRAAA